MVVKLGIDIVWYNDTMTKSTVKPNTIIIKRDSYAEDGFQILINGKHISSYNKDDDGYTCMSAVENIVRNIAKIFKIKVIEEGTAEEDDEEEQYD